MLLNLKTLPLPGRFWVFRCRGDSRIARSAGPTANFAPSAPESLADSFYPVSFLQSNSDLSNCCLKPMSLRGQLRCPWQSVTRCFLLGIIRTRRSDCRIARSAGPRRISLSFRAERSEVEESSHHRNYEDFSARCARSK